MTVDLEACLERAANALPTPSDASRAEAQRRAVAALPQPRRPSSRRRLGVIALSGAAVAVALALMLAAPWEGRSPLATERALAALGDRPVIHAVVEQTRPNATFVDLGSGAERQLFLRTEYWYDDERARLRLRLTIDGHLVTELLQTREGGLSDTGPVPGNPVEPRLDPALAGFASRYRDALESGRALVAGETTVDGRDAILIRITVETLPERPAVHQEVAVDADSYRPLRFRFNSGDFTSDWWRVLAIETVARDEEDFAAPAPAEPRPRRQTGTDEQTVTPDDAAMVLERPALWPGESVAGADLTEIAVMKLTSEWSDGRETENRALRFEYGERPRGRPGGRWLVITESTAKEMSRFGSFADAGLRPGELRLAGLGGLDGDPDLWFGWLERDGVYLGFESPQRDLVLAAARALRPIG